jgi:hypothetical protein
MYIGQFLPTWFAPMVEVTLAPRGKLNPLGGLGGMFTPSWGAAVAQRLSIEMRKYVNKIKKSLVRSPARQLKKMFTLRSPPEVNTL